MDNGEEINETIKESIDNQSIVLQTKAYFYVDIADFYNSMLWRKVQKNQFEETLKWVHIISNAKKKFVWKLP